MVKCIIVDDEKPARDEIKHHITKNTHYTILNEFDNGIDTLNFLKSNTVDIIFLDITMTGLDGIETAKKIINSPFENIPYIVFVTAYDEFAVKAFELNAIDYILKPISEERFNKCIKRINWAINNDQTSQENVQSFVNKTSKDDIISLSKDGAVFPIRVNQIKLIYIEDRTLIVETTKGRFLLNTSMNDFSKNLCEKEFFRAHRSYIININYIERIIPWFNSTYKVRIIDIDLDIPISRYKTNAFKKIMSII
ncbi:MAG TPA: LytTR family DNA-binding domain-containing protein [Clostridia bacterium]|nr:LytTR family DNA-binding domain-containing protein [Clostridia bacterium]